MKQQHVSKSRYYRVEEGEEGGGGGAAAAACVAHPVDRLGPRHQVDGGPRQLLRLFHELVIRVDAVRAQDKKNSVVVVECFPAGWERFARVVGRVRHRLQATRAMAR
jgi:hypothetical protein